MVREGEELTCTIMDAKRRKNDGGVSLPEDIVFDVLARLPAKALCRFRCVCKGWRDLISDPAFVAAQRSRAADAHLVGVFNGACCRAPEVRVMDMDGNVVKAFEITRSTPLPPQLGTRLDLICADGTGLRRRGGMIVDPAAGRAFAAFGPSDRDPTPWPMTYFDSFGRANPSGVFKVVRLQLQEPFQWDDNYAGGHQLCEVATILDGGGGGGGSSGSGGDTEPLTWRRRSAPPFVITGGSNEPRAVVNGVVYFMSDETDEDDDAAPSRIRIAAFDLESEEWKAEAINGPALGHEKEWEIWSIALVELKGTLALVQEVNVNRYWYTSIWLLVDPDKSVWVKEYTGIPMPKNQIERAKPLGALVDGRILLWSSVLEDEETGQNNTSLGRRRDVVLFYDPSTKAFTDFVEMAEGFRYTLAFYTGSLLS